MEVARTNSEMFVPLYQGRTVLLYPQLIIGGLVYYDITRFVTRLTRRVSLVEQELSTLPEHLSSCPLCSSLIYGL